MYNYKYPVNNYQNNKYPMNNYQNDRFAGAFAFPFLLGGVTGAAIAPAFWNRPVYQPQFQPYPPIYYRPF